MDDQADLFEPEPLPVAETYWERMGAALLGEGQWPEGDD